MDSVENLFTQLYRAKSWIYYPRKVRVKITTKIAVTDIIEGNGVLLGDLVVGRGCGSATRQDGDWIVVEVDVWLDVIFLSDGNMKKVCEASSSEGPKEITCTKYSPDVTLSERGICLPGPGKVAHRLVVALQDQRLNPFSPGCIETFELKYDPTPPGLKFVVSILRKRDSFEAAKFVVPLIKKTLSIVWFPMGSIVINGVVFGVTFASPALANGNDIIAAKRMAGNMSANTRIVIFYYYDLYLNQSIKISDNPSLQNTIFFNVINWP
jgi:hypothetical protein